MPAVPRPRAKKTTESATPKTDTTGTTEPKGTGIPSPASSPPPKRTPADIKLAASVRGMYEGLGMLALQMAMTKGDVRFAQLGHSLMGPEVRINMATGEPMPSDDMRTGADKLTDSWMTLADRNPRVKDALRKFTEGGAFAEVAILHIGLIYPFLPGIPGLSRFIPGSPAPDPEPTGNGATPFP